LTNNPNISYINPVAAPTLHTPLFTGGIMKQSKPEPARTRKEYLPVLHFQKFINPESKLIQFQQRIRCAGWLAVKLAL